MRRSFYVFAISFLAGVWVHSIYAFSLPEIIWFSLCALVPVVMLRYERYGLYLLLALSAGVLGAVRTEFAFRAYEGAQVYDDGVSVRTYGYVASEPDVRDDDVVLVLTLGSGTSTLRARVNVPPFPAYRYGDRVLVEGILRKPQPFETEEGRVFRFDRYLLKEDVQYLLHDATIARTAGDGGSAVTARLLELKDAWLRAIARTVPEPEASLAGGVVVGAKRSLGEEWLEAFRATGVIHIVVLSGYNLTLVANSIIRLCGFLPRGVAFFSGTLGVCAFALMTGGGATVVRASIMAIVGMLAVYLVRTQTLVRMLALAAVCMVWWNPFVLAFDSGFQLSFVATLGLVLGAPLISRSLTYVPEAFQLREIAAATIATQCAVLPLLLFHIGSVSIIAPIVNMLVLPLVPAAMLVAFIAGLCGIVSPILAAPVSWVATHILGYVFFVVMIAHSIPYATIDLPPVEPWVPALLYAALGATVWRMYRNHPTCWERENRAVSEAARSFTGK